MKSILKKIYTNLRKKSITPYTYSEKYVKLDDVYDEIFKAEKEYDERWITEIRNKAIDDFAEQLKNKLVLRYGSASPTEQYVAMQVTDWCGEIAVQMKEV